MVQSADYIYKKIKQEDLLSLAFNKLTEIGSEKFPLVRIAKFFLQILPKTYLNAKYNFEIMRLL